MYKKRIGFRGNKSKVTEDVSNVDNVPINTVNIESDTSVKCKYRIKHCCKILNQITNL